MSAPSSHLPSRLRPKSDKPWSRIPSALLHPSSVSSQVRWASSNTDSDIEKASSTKDEAEQSPQSPDFATTFGFQSLAGLFVRPQSRARYSRPRERELEAEVAPKVDSPKITTVETSKPVVDKTFFRSYPTTKESQAYLADGPSSARSNARSKHFGSPYTTYEDPATPNLMKPATISGRKKPASRSEYNTRRTDHERQKAGTKPSANKSIGHSANAVRKPVWPNDSTPTTISSDTLHSEPAQPWGLGQKDLETITSLTAPFSSPLPETTTPTSTSISTSKSSPESQMSPSTPPPPSTTLTHVSPTGKAHMVSISTKPPTLRTAIATTHIVFSNPAPFTLISENSNKKGDVLGTARLAGIMASKRTSDLIPLCHPLALTKIDVDVTLVAPGKDYYVPIGRTPRTSKFGVVSIQTLVECVGPTGVEMEALVAASGAALTVYDMCKAVDREMRIGQSAVVYKSGGRSGTWATRKWVEWVGEGSLRERGLEVPEGSNAAVQGTDEGNGNG